MDRTDFMAQAPGKLVLIRRGEYGVAEATLAFVPNPLPETLSLSMTTIRLLEDARGALGELAGTGQWLGSPNLLIRPFVRREAISSSTIEGTITTMEQLSLFEARPTEEQSETSEVANYTAAMEHGLGRLDTLPVSLRMFRELHEKLMTNVRGEEHIAGEFRQGAVVIGEHGAPVSTARFVPPPPVEMQEALYEFEQYLHREVDLPVLIRLALIHYQFETIHPFEDGNGRIGRLLIALQMVEQGLLPGPMLYLSAFFERHRREYMDRLLGVSQRAEWLPWIEFFLTGVAQQARHAVLTANSLLNLRDSYRLRLQKARGSALPLTLVDSLFDRPAIMVASAQRLLRVTPRSAQLNIEKLMAHGILTEVTGQQRNRVYVAREIIQTANS